jgi:hypothetical protein
MFIRYKTSCGSPPEVPNALVRNYDFAQLVGRIQVQERLWITPPPVYLSGPSAVPPNFLVRFDQTMCPAGGESRLLVTHGTGPSLHKFSRDVALAVTPMEAFQVALKLFRQLDVLHTYGVIHGDITWDHVVFAHNTPGSPNLITAPISIVNWDRATLIGLAPLPIVASMAMPPVHFSPTETSETPSMFHDLFRAYEIIRALLAGPDYFDRLQSRRESARNTFKREPFMAQIPALRGLTEFQAAARRLHDLVLSGVDGHRTIEQRNNQPMAPLVQELIDILGSTHS